MITLVGRWEHTWLDPSVEHFMFRQLKAAYGVDRLVMVPKLLERVTSVDQYDTMEEALESCKGQKVFMEPTGDILLEDSPQGMDLVYVFGNASNHNLNLMKDGDIKARIPTLTGTDMFAVNAAAIVLANLK